MKRHFSIQGVDNNNNNNNKRPRNVKYPDDPISQKKRSSNPLKGVIACLTGMPSDVKEGLHRTITKLGGRYTRDLRSEENTHLIATSPKGDKYDVALSCPNIQIVSPAWIDECKTQRFRAPEDQYSLVPSQDLFTQQSQQEDRRAELLQIVDDLLQQSDSIRNDGMFQSLRFYLLGFHNDNEFSSKLGRLVRRGNGFIYWMMNETITHIVLHDTCDAALRQAAEILETHHPNSPSVVSALWVVESWKAKALLPTEKYPPIQDNMVNSCNPAPHQDELLDKTTRDKGLLAKVKSTVILSSSRKVFQDCLFAMVRTAPPTWAVDFSSTKVEGLIQTHGGKMVSLKLLDVMQSDAASKSRDGTSNATNHTKSSLRRRTCYVVCWGGGTSKQWKLNPIVSKIERHDLCKLIPVSPIWLQTCVSVRKLVQPQIVLPQLMQPTPWPWRRLGQSEIQITKDCHASKAELKATMDSDTSSKASSFVRGIAVSGFSESERTAIRELLFEIGIGYVESMTANKTSHLIYKQPTSTMTTMSRKVQKALQWGLHVVSIEWLFHVLQYGYFGDPSKSLGTNQGCEDRFYVEW